MEVEATVANIVVEYPGVQQTEEDASFSSCINGILYIITGRNLGTNCCQRRDQLWRQVVLRCYGKQDKQPLMLNHETSLPLWLKNMSIVGYSQIAAIGAPFIQET